MHILSIKFDGKLLILTNFRLFVIIFVFKENVFLKLNI